MLPPEARLAMPRQNLTRPFRDSAVPEIGADYAAPAVRALIAGVVIALTAGCGREMVDILAKGGLSVLELVMAASFIASFVWIALSAVSALAGAILIALGLAPGPARRAGAGMPQLTVALLIPTCNEAPDQVFGNAVAMLKALERHPTQHRFSLFILSDSTQPEICAAELKAFAAARGAGAGPGRLYYRRRRCNDGRKAGNIAEWCRRWGGRYDAFLTLDADSVMGARAVAGLTDALAGDPSAALVQSVPQLARSDTLFGRMHEFATAVYGPPLAAGQALWSRGEANYWGHNAIIRTRAFAACAGLPRLPGRRPFGGEVMSHDFVEAALLRRAGWRVRMLPELAESFEQTPPTLVDTALRDRRWCQGNLQHLGVVGAAGLHPVSRFHLLQGIMAYVSSLLWFLFLAAGTAVAMRAGAMPVDYFPEPHVLFPSWPMIDAERAVWLLLVTACVLLVPKIAGIALVAFRGGVRAGWGGMSAFLASALVEIVLSAVIAPILMVQHSLAVVRTIAGIDAGWTPQRRAAGRIRSGALIRFHAAETVIGAGLGAGMLANAIPLWLAPIALSLVFAVAVSALSARAMPRPITRLFAVPWRLDPPPVLTAAYHHGARIRGGGAREAAPAAAGSAPG